MKLKDVIRTRRQALGWTQECLAGKLGVSAPAVNKWERGLNYPDITLLPPLARALGVDLNTLLSFQEDPSEQEIGLFLGDVYAAAQTDGCAAAFALARDKLLQFPNSDLLAYSLASLLEGLLAMAPAESSAEKSREESMVSALYERLADSTDPRVREAACHTLAGKCIQHGDLERAQTLLDQLSDTHAGKRALTAALRRKEGNISEAWILLEQDLMNQATNIQSTLLSMLDMALAEQDLRQAQALSKIAAEAGRALEQSDYAVLSAPLQLATATQNAPEALKLLEQLLQSLTLPWTPADTVLYRHMPPKENSENVQSTLIRPLLDELEQDPSSRFLVEHPAYQSLAEKYRALAP